MPVIQAADPRDEGGHLANNQGGIRSDLLGFAAREGLDQVEEH
jgi:hypothetical protein